MTTKQATKEEAATPTKEDDDLKKKESDGNGEAKKSSDELATVAEVFSFAKRRRTRIYIAAACFWACVSGAVLPAFIFYWAEAFESLSASTSSDSFLAAVRENAFVFLILGGITMTSMSLQTMFMETAAGQMTREFQDDWFRALLRQDMAYYDLKDVAGQATLISASAKKFKKGVGRKLAEAIQFFINSLGGIIYAFIASWEVTLIMLAISPLMYLTTIFIIRIQTTQTSRANKAYAKAGAVVSTAVKSIRTILSLNAVEKMVDMYKESTLFARDTAIANSYALGLANGGNFATMVLAYMVALLFGSFLLYRGVEEDGCDPSGSVQGAETCNPSGSGVFGALFGVSVAVAVLPQISIALESFTNARAACYPALVAMRRNLDGNKVHDDDDIEGAISNGDIRKELDSLPKYEIDSSSPQGLKPDYIKGDIEFKNVYFSFPARREAEVLKGLSLSIEQGKTVALVGRSGCGKSTLVQLLERFYDPISGSITLDGNDLKSLNVKWLRQQIGLVLQEPKLFAKSIKENISLGSSAITQEMIEEAAKNANAHDFIMSFPEKYDTQVGDLGGQLSGGQRQRIALARCLVRKPKILILDEATSALDSESEKAVQEALDETMKMKSATTVVIAHRLSTIKNADLIAVVEDGRIVETGTHTELLNRQERYFDLVQAQKTKTSDDDDDDQVNGLTNSEQYFDLVQGQKTKKNNGNQFNSQNKKSFGTPYPSDEYNSTTEESPSASFMFDDSDVPVVRFKDVRFRYPARPENEVFRGLNLDVRKGETLAIVGPSGSGKSTVIQLIECFYHPNGGSVEYNGVGMRDLNIKWLRDELGLVSQEATLFDTTIQENIQYGCPDATMEEVVEAAKKANCHNFISEFPQGYNTVIGEGGSLVSGGQKQRIACARALVKKPRVLLLDEATSALDSESEKIVQEALDRIMEDRNQTCIVIAHRLSTIRNADRIAVIEKGRVTEIGSHNELMAKPRGRYRRLQQMQNLGADLEHPDDDLVEDHQASIKKEEQEVNEDVVVKEDDEDKELTKDETKAYTRRAWQAGSKEMKYIYCGSIGALLAGIFFPAWGITFAYMVDIFYQRAELCPPYLGGFDTCDEYYSSVASDMQQMSFNITYGYIGLMVVAIIGNVILFFGFGSASERMNKRVRDDAFKNLLRQEVAWFDVRAPGTITAHLSDDAAMLHAFAGEPFRTLIVSVSSVVIGLVVCFVYMWEFALLVLGLLPFLAFGAEMEMQMYMGDEDVEADDEEKDEHSSGGIVIETLSNMRTIASLTLEEERAAEYDEALLHEDPRPLKNNLVKGAASGVGQFFQFGSFGAMFWFGGWLILNRGYTYLAYLIAMFALFFSMYGLTIAAQGAVDRTKATAAAVRIFELTDRKSKIDPLSEEGKKLLI